MGKVGYDKGKAKRLSKAYLMKKKCGKIQKMKNKTGENQSEHTKARIIIRNISFKATENDIKRLYEPFGEIEEINLLRRPDGKIVGCGFVQFKKEQDASKAIFKTNKTEHLGRTINCAWAIPKAKYYEQIKKEEENKEEIRITQDESCEIVENKDNDDIIVTEKEKKMRKTKITPEERKLQKLKRRKKKARIIVRNLPFKATEEAVKEFFSKFGKIEEIKILTKPDGTRIGCGFVQFELFHSAAKAIKQANMKQFLNRSIVVDWAISKDAYIKKENKEIKEEIVEIKKEIEDEEKEENDVSLGQCVSEIKIEESDNENQSDDDKDGNVEDEESDVSESKINLPFRRKEYGNMEENHPRRISNDVQEGKTVFLKNVPFRATNEDLKKCMEQFGPVYYALLCIDPLTEHSKGTAFVKFQNVEDAEKCLSAGTELQMLDQILDPHRALLREQIHDKKDEKPSKAKDSRNLYLVREGVILAGSPAAVGVSASDMTRRLQLEQWKSQMLRNLNMFVSRIRLVIHNLPATFDDVKLRKLFQSYSGYNIVITEARVMRDLRNVDGKGVGKSKEYGFVSFTKHEDALKALRTINNNPEIFTKTKRPIVAFSIENRIMVNAKQKRIIKSRERNPLCSEYKKFDLSKELPAKKMRMENEQVVNDKQSYSGVQSKTGPVKMRSKFNIKKQALLHTENLKKEKRKMKLVKKQKTQLQERSVSNKEIKPKQNKKKQNTDEAYFQKFVNNYKSQLIAASEESKSKWYET